MKLYPPSFAFLLFILLLSQCREVKSIEGLDTAAWKADRHACNRIRIGLENSFMENKNKLKGYSQQEIGKVLGKPDEVDLYKRNQKFFIYYIMPGKQCEGVTLKSRPRSLYIRFSAMNVSNEVFVKDY